ncbi:hypothetical protein HIM_12436 [Hirsutella minnesotensis 3608]|uniref:Transcription factor domain-containing protein n=1 Tax=Hirsutella minnesotensis 3608 TaxID=1043627 RepID=A0A0F7ZQN4_9HYPO|nr:hypothetical protein HIM_12436 [Hirsutella minnesotensis 3608]
MRIDAERGSSPSESVQSQSSASNHSLDNGSDPDYIKSQNDFFVHCVSQRHAFDSHQAYLTSLLYSSPATLQDAFMALALSRRSETEPSIPEHQLCFYHASNAISTLRNLEVGNAQEATVCLALGSMMLSFDLRLGFGNTRSICIHSLSLSRPWHGVIRKSSAEDADLLDFLLFKDTSESLLQADVPTVRVDSTAEVPLSDPHTGHCAALLPLLHDICELNYELSCQRIYSSDIFARLESLEQSVENWSPEPNNNPGHGLHDFEAAHLECQSRVMKATALIILHRLQYPYDCRPQWTLGSALAILHDLDDILQETKLLPRHADLPLLVACFEVSDDKERERWLSKFSPTLNYASRSCEWFKDIASEVWAARRKGRSFYWYDICRFDGLKRQATF